MITRHGQYIDDLNKPGMVHVAFVRSTVAQGAGSSTWTPPRRARCPA